MANGIAKARNWAAYQWRVWKWGAQVTAMFAVWAAVSILTGGIVASVAATALGWDASPVLWVACSALIAPFFASLPVSVISGLDRETRTLALWRRQNG